MLDYVTVDIAGDGVSFEASDPLPSLGLSRVYLRDERGRRMLLWFNQASYIALGEAMREALERREEREEAMAEA